MQQVADLAEGPGLDLKDATLVLLGLNFTKMIEKTQISAEQRKEYWQQTGELPLQGAFIAAMCTLWCT